MRNAMVLPTAAIVGFTVCACSGTDDDTDALAIAYPETAMVDHVDDYHGTEVADPYRWLEDDVRESERVKQWVDEQNDVTFAYLATIEERAAIERRMTELWDYERYFLPQKAGGRYFYAYNDGLQNQEVIFTQEDLDAEPRLLVDPNTWSDDGTVALAAYYPSPDGSQVAYLIQDGGSDWRTARVLDVATGDVLDDHLEWLKFTALSWAGDGSGFYYSRYPETSEEDKYQSLNKNMTVHFHRIGTPQSEDLLIYAIPEEPDWGPRAEVTDDGNHLVITISIGTDDRYQIAYRDLRDPDGTPRTLIEGFDHDYTLVGSVGDELLFRSNNDAPKNRLIAIDPSRPEPENWREVIAEREDVLDYATLVGGRIVAQYMQDAWSVIRIFDLEGNETGRVDLPGIGTATGFAGKWDDAETFLRTRVLTRRA